MWEGIFATYLCALFYYVTESKTDFRSVVCDLINTP